MKKTILLNNNNYSELNRKLFHIVTLLYPVFYNIWPRKIIIFLSGTLLLLDIVIETLRLRIPAVNKFLLNIFQGIYRGSEKNNISGLIWTLSGTLLTILLFNDEKVVTVSLLYLVFGDSTAALVGTLLGKIKFANKKSLEGSISCFIICLICGLFFFPWQIALIGAFVATIIEVLPLPFSDNLWLPLLSGFVLTFLTNIL